MPDTFPISEHVAAMKGSSTLITAQLAGEMRARGEDVIDLEVGIRGSHPAKIAKAGALTVSARSWSTAPC